MAEVQKTILSGELTQRFIEFVLMHAQNAALFLGQIPNPKTGEPEVNLDLARMFIDQLAMIQEKTRGNLTSEEAKVLHDRGGLFSLDPASPNALAGRKRPLHTIIPAFAQKGDSRVAFGIMGGWNQSQAHAQFIADLADFKMNIQAALEAPRFSKHSFGGCDVMMENRIPQKVRDELAAKGHQIALKGTFSSVVGGGQAVMRDFSTGVNYGASDPRKDGQAVAEIP